MGFTFPPQNNTASPSWSLTITVPNSVFSLKSYLVVQLLNQTYANNNETTFIGGAEATVSQVETLPQTTTVVLTNSAGLETGTFSFSWAN